MTAKPIAELKNAVDLRAAGGENVQVDIAIRPFEHAVLVPLWFADVEAVAGAFAGERKYGRAANLPAHRPRKPTDEDMGPHNWGGGEARPKGGGRMRRRGRG